MHIYVLWLCLQVGEILRFSWRGTEIEMLLGIYYTLGMEKIEGAIHPAGEPTASPISQVYKCHK